MVATERIEPSQVMGTQGSVPELLPSPKSMKWSPKVRPGFAWPLVGYFDYSAFPDHAEVSKVRND